MSIPRISQAAPAVVPSQVSPPSRVPISAAQSAIQIANLSLVSKPIVPVKAASSATLEQEANLLETMIQKHQNIIKVEESKWFGNKDVSSHKYEISRLVHDLINVLGKLFSIQLPLFNIRQLSPQEEIKFGKLIERLVSACELGGKDYSKNADQAKIVRDDVRVRVLQVEAREKMQAELKQKIASFGQWVAIPEKHETVRGIFGLWNSKSAVAEIQKMKVQLAKIAVEIEEDNVAMKFKNANTLTLLTDALKGLIDKKQTLVSLLPEGSIDRMNVERDIGRHKSEIEKLNKQFQDHQNMIQEQQQPAQQATRRT